MSLRLEMLQVARLAPKLLGGSADLVKGFLHGRQNEDGGFQDRGGRSDLYYTVFGLEGLLALQDALGLASTASYLGRHGDGDGLDFVPLCCLARCWAGLESAGAPGMPPAARAGLAARILAFRARDGGFAVKRESDFGTAYGGFLALGALQDLRAELPQPDRLRESVAALATPDGAWSNDRHVPRGGTNATAAAIGILRALGEPVPPDAKSWLRQQGHRQGGFVAAPGAPLPDLLSTATALHALSALEADLTELTEPCLDFIDTLWTNEGGFHGHWGDDWLDTEYTYYGLLALGHLSIWIQ